MLTKTSLSAIRALIYLGYSRNSVLPPSHIAEALEESPTYLAKITRQLVKAGLLRAVRGAKGGVQFGRPPGEISLLEIVQACQGVIVGDFCEDMRDTRGTCAFHEAMADLHEATTGVLRRWSLAELIDRPKPQKRVAGGLACRLRWAEAERAMVRLSKAKSGPVHRRHQHRDRG
jgi:Rrf2 family protein